MRRVVSAIGVVGLLATDANAALTITIEESGGDVVATASGSLDVRNLPRLADSLNTAALTYLAPNQWFYAVGVGYHNRYVVTWNTAQPLQSSPSVFHASLSSGYPVAVSNTAGTPGSFLLVPQGYISGNPISSSSTWAGASLASLNLTPGAYLFDYGIDTVTFNVMAPPLPSIDAARPVPALSAIGLLLGGIGIVGVGMSSMRFAC
jgi:hypothetical protein